MASRERSWPARPGRATRRAAGCRRCCDRLIDPFRRGAARAPPATGFYTDTTVCIGCKACEVACKQWNQLPADGFDWTGNSYDNTGELSATSWRHVKFIEQFTRQAVRAGGCPARTADASRLAASRWLMMSDVCKHCVAAPCQQACPTGAIIHNEFANVYIQPDICNGCAYCIAACPFGVITRSTSTATPTSARSATTGSGTAWCRPAPRRARRRRSSSARSTSCASGRGSGWRSCTSAASPRPTCTATRPTERTPSCIRSTAGRSALGVRPAGEAVQPVAAHEGRLRPGGRGGLVAIAVLLAALFLAGR